MSTYIFKKLDHYFALGLQELNPHGTLPAYKSKLNHDLLVVLSPR
jgi:hypothetical protein